jgi:Ca2+-binding RTX toxin-like protein
MATVKGATSVPTTFEPDPTLTSTPTSPTVFVGGDTSADGSVLDLSGIVSPDADGNVVSAVTVPMDANTSAQPGQVTADVAGVPVQFATIAGVNLVLGSPGGTTFQPGTANGLRFTGQPREPNVLDLTSESASNFSSISVAMSSASCTGGGQLSTSGGTPDITDSFCSMATVKGATSVPTTFKPDPTLTSTPTSPTVFVGGDTSANGSVLDLSGIVSPDSDGNVVSAVTVPMGANTSAQPGQVTADVAGVPVLFATFSSVDQVLGSPGGTVFQPGTARDVTFVGSGTANTLDLSSEPAGISVQLSGPSSSCPSGGELATLVVGTGTDRSCAITTFIGSSQGSNTFQSDGIGGHTFQGGGTANVLDLSNAPAGLTVGASSVTGLTGGADTFSDIQQFVGSSSGSNTFVAPGTGGGFTFSGHGSGNTLDFSAFPAGARLDETSGTAALSASAADTFSNVSCFVGSSQGSTTFVAATGKQTVTGCDESSSPVNFQGQGIGNKLDLSGLNASAQSPVVVSVGAGSASGSGSTLTFAKIGSFVGSSFGSTTFRPDASTSYSFTGQSVGNALSFDSLAAGGPGITIDLAKGEVTGGPLAGIDVFSGVQSIVGSPNNDTFIAAPVTMSLDGGGGSNTLDLSHATSQVTLDLGQATPQATGGAGVLMIAPNSFQTVIGSNFGNQLTAGPGNVTLQGGSGIDRLQAGSGTDSLIAGSGPSTLVGGSGYDTMRGGAGADTFIPGTGGGKIADTSSDGTIDYAAATAGVQVNLGTKSYVVTPGVVLLADTATGGGGKTYALSGVSNIIGSTHGDILVGSSGSNLIKAGGGTTLIVGDGGGDTLIGGTGANVFVTGPGNNAVRGGSGSNTVDYASAPSAVNVNLRSGTAKNGFGGTDSLSGIANIIGSNNNGDQLSLGTHAGTIYAGNGGGDALVGSKAGGSTMFGGGGSDKITSVGANDHMIGGTGNDTFHANNGFKDFIVGGKGHNIAYVDCLDVRYKTYSHVQVVHKPSNC